MWSSVSTAESDEIHGPTRELWGPSARGGAEQGRAARTGACAPGGAQAGRARQHNPPRERKRAPISHPPRSSPSPVGRTAEYATRSNHRMERPSATDRPIKALSADELRSPRHACSCAHRAQPPSAEGRVSPSPAAAVAASARPFPRRQWLQRAPSSPPPPPPSAAAPRVAVAPPSVRAAPTCLGARERRLSSMASTSSRLECKKTIWMGHGKGRKEAFESAGQRREGSSERETVKRLLSPAKRHASRLRPPPHARFNRMQANR